jgi:sulfate transport system ATP-binding protein
MIREIRLQGGQIGLNIECEGLDCPIEAEVPRELFINLELAKGVQVFVTINRVKVFAGDYEI